MWGPLAKGEEVCLRWSSTVLNTGVKRKETSQLAVKFPTLSCYFGPRLNFALFQKTLACKIQFGSSPPSSRSEWVSVAFALATGYFIS